MMTFEQYLLLKVAEECNEVAQRALKAAQFGLDEVQKGQNLNNAERIYAEFNDLMAILAMMNATITGFSCDIDEDAIEAKQEKVVKYLALSIKQGQVSPEHESFAAQE